MGRNKNRQTNRGAKAPGVNPQGYGQDAEFAEEPKSKLENAAKKKNTKQMEKGCPNIGTASKLRKQKILQAAADDLHREALVPLIFSLLFLFQYEVQPLQVNILTEHHT